MALQSMNYVSGTARAVIIADLIDKQTPLVKMITQDVNNKLSAGDNLTLNIKIPGRGHVVDNIVKEADFALKVNALRSVTLTKKTVPQLIAELDDSSTIEEWKTEVADPIKETFATDINKRTYAAIMSGVDSAILSETVGGGKFQDLSDAIANVRNSRLSGRISGALNNSLMAQVRNSGNDRHRVQRENRSSREQAA